MTAMTDHIPVVDTDRLRLRAPKLADLPAIEALYRSDRSRMIGGPKDARGVFGAVCSTIGSWALRGHGFWQIADRETDAWLGATGILYAPGWDEPELGWHLAAEAEGRGIAFEAAQAARRYAARHLGHDGVISYIVNGNHRSVALAERLGAWLERDTVFLETPCHIYRHPAEATAQ